MIPESVKEFLDANQRALRFVVFAAVVVGVGAWILHDPPVEIGDTEARKVVVLLHGYGASKDDLAPLAVTLAGTVPDSRYVMPQAPHSMLGGYTWLPSFTAESQAAVDARMLELREEARGVVMEVVDDLLEDGVQPGDIYLGGFSQGAVIALDVMLNEPGAAGLGGLLYLSGGGLKMDLSSLQGRPPMRTFISHAERDPRVGIGDAKKLASALEAGGHPVQFVTFETGHTIPPEVIQSLRDFLQEY